ncbi:hypothetical protein [Ralstonia pseudosolanacearum]|uniref:Ankyrin repeat domain-containing protein n=1 Tax=Ralstonia solanacearum TaxID=305 RepID=A0ABY6NG80_RALSL|nr:hypothetical protein LH706_06670 [Ralstonia solanacearum]
MDENLNFRQELKEAISNGDLQIVRHLIEESGKDIKIFPLGAFLRGACIENQLEIVDYLIDLPTIGEHDLNVAMIERNWEKYQPLKEKMNSKLELINATKQKELSRAVYQGDFKSVKEIVESKNYFDLFSALYGAASIDNVKITAYLFDKINIREDQEENLIKASGPEARMWIKKYHLRQALNNDLTEKDEGQRHKI